MRLIRAGNYAYDIFVYQGSIRSLIHLRVRQFFMIFFQFQIR